MDTETSLILRNLGFFKILLLILWQLGLDIPPMANI